MRLFRGWIYLVQIRVSSSGSFRTVSAWSHFAAADAEREEYARTYRKNEISPEGRVRVKLESAWVPADGDLKPGKH